MPEKTEPSTQIMPPQRKGIIDRIRHFTPSWFAVPMGTGIIGILINNLPYGGTSARHTISLIILIVNTLLFVIFTAISIARYVIFPQIWPLMLRDPVQSLFLGCFPMALATIISASVSVSQNRRGLVGLTPFLWSLWWIDVAMCLASCILFPYIMITRHKHSPEQQNATWLLPVVPPIVTASCGAIVAGALIDHSPEKAAITVGVSCFLLITGLFLAMMMTTTYLTRLVAHGFPKAGLVVSVFLPLGPCGQGGFAFLILSQHIATLLTARGLEGALFAKIGVAIATCAALTLWTIGFWFAIISGMGLLEVAYRSSVPFKVNFWGMIFPWGVYSLLTLQLGKDLDLQLFRVLGTIFAGYTTILWVAIATKTVYLAFEGSIFHAPCLDDNPLVAQWPSNQTTVDMDITQLETARQGNGNSIQ